VSEFSHHTRTAKKSLSALLVSGEVVVQHLDRDAPVFLPIMGVPDHGEPAATDLLDEEIATVAQICARPQLAAVTQLSTQLEDLAMYLVGLDASFPQLLLPHPSVLELFAERSNLRVLIGRFRPRPYSWRRQQHAHRRGAGIR
jgi:hypothetical protein